MYCYTVIFSIIITSLCLNIESAYYSAGRRPCYLTEDLPDPKSQCCGVDAASFEFIVGGNKTLPRQYPWLVLIEYFVHPHYYGSMRSLCGGSLMSGRHVITAGHCVSGKLVEHASPHSVRLGEYDRKTNPDYIETEDGGRRYTDRVVTIEIDEIMLYEEPFRKFNIKHNDIAIIRLRDLAPYTDFIRPICLPTSDITLNPPEDLTLTAAGWGIYWQQEIEKNYYSGRTSRVKREVDVPYVTRQQCDKEWDSITKYHICAGGEKMKDACTGDSGGPLMYNQDGIYYLVGIISYGKSQPCGSEGVPGVYTNVYKYRIPINNAILKLENDARERLKLMRLEAEREKREAERKERQRLLRLEEEKEKREAERKERNRLRLGEERRFERQRVQREAEYRPSCLNKIVKFARYVLFGF